MVISKTLLLKGLGGASALLGTGGLVLFRKEIFGIKKEMDLSSFKDKELIDKVGLDCQLSGDELTDTDPKDCTVKTNGTINVKKGDQVEEGVSYSSGTQKLKVSRSTEGDYSKNLKFVVDSGNITLTKTGGGSLTINNLEQFETYEITAEAGGKFYLTRKTEAKGEKKNILGLSKCEFPESGSRDCSFTTEEIKKVKFDGQSDGVTVTGESVSLKISKTGDTSFTDGYRFTFTFPSEVTNPSIKANISTDFKIKKESNSNTLTLEKAWSDDNTFTKKAGLDCSSNNNTECTVPSGSSEKLNVKVGDKKKEGIASLESSSGKIKIEKEKVGYNQGLKFTITTSDVTWTNGGQGDITKLEELETYEITEEGGKYYLSRKEEANKTIKDSLGLPEGCNLPSSGSVDCVVQEAQSKNIKFDGKETNKPTGPLTLKIEKTNDNNFPKGYKFTLVSASDVALSTSSTIKRNTNTEFKIKRETSSSGISLEKAWTPTTLGAKVGLESCTTNNECTLNNSGIKVIQDDKKDTNLSKDNGSTNGKIKVYKDQEGYNQGFKFTIEEANISLTGSSAQNENDKIKSLDEYETYEIKKEGNEWYLERKIKAQDFLKKELGLDNCSFPSDSAIPETCNNIDLEKLKKIKFEGHSGHNWTESSAKVEIEITKEGNASTLPNGLKFIFKNNGNGPITVPTGSNKTTQIKKDGELDFKIKKTGSGSSVTLTLEKAWSINDLANNISGLTCTDNNNTKQCTVSSQISVWKDGSNYWKEATVSGSGTLTYEEGVKGFNKGFKLSSTSNISLTKNSTNSYSVGDSNPFEVNVGYEITQATFGSANNKAWCLAKKSS